MVLGLLFGMTAVWALAEGAHVVRGGMTSAEAKKFDKMNGARGIDPMDVVKIAQRNGVYPNKHGVLPVEPNDKIMDYVKRYANSVSDVKEFERQWNVIVKKQLDKKHEKIQAESKDDYIKTKNYYETSVIPYLGNDVTYLEIKHWMFMPYEVHEQRMRNIIDKTVFGEFVKSSALREDHMVEVEAYVEYYELKLPKNSDISSYEFKELLKKCCNYLGFEHGL